MSTSAENHVSDDPERCDKEDAVSEPFWDSEGVFRSAPPTVAVLQETLARLCTTMEYLRSWWSAQGDLVRSIPEANSSRIHDYFVEGCASRKKHCPMG